MESLAWIVFGGLVAALAMAVFLIIIDHTRATRSNMMWTIGNLFFSQKRKAETFGLSMHLIAGMAFAPLYVAAWALFDLRSPGDLMMIGLITGLVHGIAVGMALIILVQDNDDGFAITLTHVAAHMLFGLVLGASIAALNPSQNIISEYANLIYDEQGGLAMFR